MKWAKVSAPANAETKEHHYHLDDQNNRLCYKEFESEAALEKELVHSKNVWAYHEFIYDFGYDAREKLKELQKKDPKAFESMVEEAEMGNFKKFQQRYEIFTGGYLEFYDRIVRRRVVDHVVYFKWLKLGRGKDGNLYAVKIFLSPAPMRYKPYSTHYNAQSANELYQNEQNFSTATSETPDELATDPPPPPPPPPPSMH
jgi:hypothetical protein